jgi:protein ImuA
MHTATQTRPSPLEHLHPALWRASQLARADTRCIDTGFASLSRQLPGGGWPTGCLVDVLTQQAGIQEIQLLVPALRQLQERQVFLLQPPHVPQILGFAGMGLHTENVLWVKSKTTADSLWAAEHILRSGCAGSLLFWTTQIRSESLRRLHLAAQSSESLFFLLRPLAAAQDASPAPLRISLRPAHGGIDIQFVKRRGPQRDEDLFVAIDSPNNFVRRSTPVQVPAIQEDAPVQSKQQHQVLHHNIF